MSASPEPPAPPPVTQSAGFWPLMGYAASLGVFGGFAGLVFLGVIGHGEKWNAGSNPQWLGGHWWWVAVTAAAGLIVGLLHRWLHVPEQTPGIIAEIDRDATREPHRTGTPTGRRRATPTPRGTRSAARRIGPGEASTKKAPAMVK